MPQSPSANRNRIVSCLVYSNGKKLGADFRLVSARASLALNRIGKATLKFEAGNMEKQIFDESDSAEFKLGASIKLDVGNVGKEEAIFEGTVTALRILTGKDGRSYMVVECRDIAYPATLGRKNRIFENKTDSEIIKEVLRDYGSVSVDATENKQSALVQYYCTDWDFALSRADACGLYLCIDGGKINVKKPQAGSSPVMAVAYGEDVISFDLELNSDDQFAQYEGVTWNPKTQKVIRIKGSSPTLNKHGDLPAKAIAASDIYLIQTDAPMDEKALKQWTDSAALKAGLARYQGTVTICGSPKAKPGILAGLKGFGKRFNGNMFVGSVSHLIENNQWTTELGAGVTPFNITEETDVMSPSASGFLPGLQGIHSAVVKKLDADPEKGYRIQVELPWLDGTNKSLWARMSTMLASQSFGTFFLPDIGDEVLIGFMNQDPSHPIVIGSLYSEKHKPPYEFEAKNSKKAIVSREKLCVLFDEEKKAVTISTPGKNTIEISDGGKCIKLTDQNKNEVTLDSSGITLSSAKDIVIKAKGAIKMEANAKITGEAKQDVSLKGINVKLQAKAGATIKGNATAELSASGQTTVKGAMVMIN